MSAKLATVGLPKIKILWNKDYNVRTFVHDVTKYILPLEPNYNVDALMWRKFGYSTIFMTGVS